MQLIRAAVLSTTMLAGASAGLAWGEISPDLPAMWDCPQVDGTSLYTNKEKAGCQAMSLKPLSVVPDLEHMPTIPRPTPTAAPHYDVPLSQDRVSGMGGRQVPDWARDWYAGVAPTGGSVREEVCTLYSEWLHLVQKTRGGMFYGSDPSYGGDLSGRNQRGASYSFYDNSRYIALSRIFGTGFVPVGCF